MGKTKRKKLFYVPGILSLIFIPIIFISLAIKQQKRFSVSTMPIFWADTMYFKKHNLYNPIYRQFPPNRNYIEIILTGNNKDDQIKLNFSQIRIRGIISANDSINGLHIKFIDNAEYWTFIRALDILNIEGAKTYIPFENNLWFYNVPPDTTVINWTCGTTYNDNLFVRPKISFWEKFNKEMSAIWSTSWQLILGFLVLVIFAIVHRQKENVW